MIKTITKLLTIVSLIGIYSCSKTNDLTPNQNAVGLNGTSECVTKGYIVSDDYGSIVYKKTFTYFYNEENKVDEYWYPSYVDKSIIEKITFQENKENLGSDTKPYVIEFKDKVLSAKYYCNKDGRVNKKENFSSGSNFFPFSTEYEEYDNNGNHSKSTTREQNLLNGSLTGNYSIFDAEYERGNLVKLYLTDNNLIYGLYFKRHLFNEYNPGSIPNKNIISFLFNYGVNDFGKGNRNHPKGVISFHVDGSVYRQGNFTYKLDSKGYLSSSFIKYLDGSIEEVSGYTYKCK